MKVVFAFCKQIKIHKRHTLNLCVHLEGLFKTKCLHYWRRVTKFLCSDKKDILLRPWWLIRVLHLFVLIIFHIGWLIDLIRQGFGSLHFCPAQECKESLLKFSSTAISCSFAIGHLGQQRVKSQSDCNPLSIVQSLLGTMSNGDQCTDCTPYIQS